MKTEITYDCIDNINWMVITCRAATNQLDHEALAWLDLMLQSYKYSVADAYTVDQDAKTYYVENPEPQLDKKIFLWKMQN